jgi:hypothetical protein
MSIDWIPMPGQLLENSLSIHIVDRFKQTFRVLESDPYDIRPSWCYFPNGKYFGGEEVIESVMSNLLQLNHSLFIYLEGTSDDNSLDLYKANAQEIKTFFEERFPWQDKDYYVFDDSYGWCLAITHDDAVIAVGSQSIIDTLSTQ